MRFHHLLSHTKTPEGADESRGFQKTVLKVEPYENASFLVWEKTEAFKDGAENYISISVFDRFSVDYRQPKTYQKVCVFIRKSIIVYR